MSSYDFPSEKVKFERVGAFQYVGVAPSGSLSSANVWKIMRLEYSGNEVVSIEWADGNKNYDNAWDDRATKIFS